MRTFKPAKVPVTSFPETSKEIANLSDAIRQIEADITSLQGGSETSTGGSGSEPADLVEHDHSSSAEGGADIDPSTCDVSGNATVGGTLTVTGNITGDLDRLTSTANDSELTLTDDGSDQTLAGNLGTLTIQASGAAIYFNDAIFPYGSATLGNSGTRWDGYLSTFYLSSQGLKSDIIPDADVTRDLGSATYKFDWIYGRNLSITTGGSVSFSSAVDINEATNISGTLTMDGSPSDIVMSDNSITGIDTLTFTDSAGTIAGIQNQNLLDKTATETVSGQYTFSYAGAAIKVNEGIFIGTGTPSGNTYAIEVVDDSGDTYDAAAKFTLNYATTSSSYGCFMSVSSTGTTEIVGASCTGKSTASAGTVAETMGVQGIASTSGASAKTDVVMFQAEADSLGGGTITNLIGFYGKTIGQSAKGAATATNVYTAKFMHPVHKTMSNEWTLYCEGLSEFDGTVQFDGDIDHNGTNIGLWGVTPTTRPTAFTQTYSTATKTHSALTSATLTDSSGGSTDNTVAAVSDNSETTNNTTINDNFAEVTEEINALRVDMENTKQVLNQVIDDLQSYGALQ